MRVDVAAASHVGRVRKLNEDSYLLSDAGLAVVADGMGGHACGDVASAMAIASFEHFSPEAPPTPGLLLEAVRAANQRILSEAAANPEKAGMGTTITGLAAVAQGGVPHWFVFNVGDSRTYRYADHRLTQVTVDHAEIAELIAAGSIDPSEARSHPLRHVITRALGSEPAEPDTWIMPAEGAEVFVLCSDGLPNEVTDEQIADILSGTSSARDAADELVSAALLAGGRDNVTVIVVRSDADRPEETKTATLPRADLFKDVS